MGTISILPPRYDDNKAEILIGKFVYDTFMLILNYISHFENLHKIESHKCFETLTKLTIIMSLQLNVSKSIAYEILDKIGDTLCNFRIRCFDCEHGMFYSMRAMYFNLLTIVNDLIILAEDYLSSNNVISSEYVLLEVKFALYDFAFKKVLPKVYNSLIAHTMPFLRGDCDLAVLIECEHFLTPIVDTLLDNKKVSVRIQLEKARDAISTLAIVKSFTFIEIIFDIL